MKTLLPFLIAATLALVGCQDRYRYACQDPNNWEKPECKRPACESDGVCPDMLLGKPIEEENKFEAVESGEACNCTDQEEPQEEPQGE